MLRNMDHDKLVTKDSRTFIGTANLKNTNQLEAAGSRMAQLPIDQLFGTMRRQRCEDREPALARDIGEEGRDRAPPLAACPSSQGALPSPSQTRGALCNASHTLPVMERTPPGGDGERH